MSRYVLDSFAVLASLHQEPGWERVDELIAGAGEGRIDLCMSVINIAEVKYRIARYSRDRRQAFAAVDALPIIRLSADPHVDRVIDLKADYAISLADCFAAAAAMELGCPVVTGDPEFAKLQDVVQVEWLR